MDEKKQKKNPAQLGFLEKAGKAAAETRRAALHSISGGMPALRARVYAEIRDAPDGLTCDEAEVRIELPHQTVSARVNELMTAGTIVAAGRRKTRSGRNAVVWVATERIAQDPARTPAASYG